MVEKMDGTPNTQSMKTTYSPQMIDTLAYVFSNLFFDM